jgi:hypothetical protein
VEEFGEIKIVGGYMNYTRQRHERCFHEINEFHPMIHISSFNGDLDIAKFLDWVAKCNRLQECMNISEEKIKNSRE